MQAPTGSGPAIGASPLHSSAPCRRVRECDRASSRSAVLPSWPKRVGRGPGPTSPRDKCGRAGSSTDVALRRLKRSSRHGGPFAGGAAAPGWASPRLVPRGSDSGANLLDAGEGASKLVLPHRRVLDVDRRTLYAAAVASPGEAVMLRARVWTLLRLAQCRSVQLGVASVLVFLNCGRTRLESTYALYGAPPPAGFVTW